MNFSIRIPASAFAFALIMSSSMAQQNPPSVEVSFIAKALPPISSEYQRELRDQNAWRTFSAAQPKWSVEFNESSGRPHRAYGPGIPTSGGTVQERVPIHHFGMVSFGVDPLT